MADSVAATQVDLALLVEHSWCRATQEDHWTVVVHVDSGSARQCVRVQQCFPRLWVALPMPGHSPRTSACSAVVKGDVLAHVGVVTATHDVVRHGANAVAALTGRDNVGNRRTGSVTVS